MDEKVMLWRLGILVLSTILVAATLVLYLGQGFQPTYLVKLRCEKAPGVTPETPVHRNGILIGRVDDVEMLEEGGVEIKLKINRGIKLYTDEDAQIGMTSILGESVIEFVPGSGGEARDVLAADETLSGNKVKLMTDPLELLREAMLEMKNIPEDFATLQSNINETTEIIKGAATSFKEIATKVDGALGNDGQQSLAEFFQSVNSLSQNADEMVQTFNLIGQDIQTITGDPQTQFSIANTIQQFPGLMDSAKTSIENLGETSGKINAVVEKADKQLTAIGQLTEKLTKDEFIQSLEGSLNGIEEFLSSIKNSKGTIGLLLNDPSVYNRMNNSLRRIESITYKLEPILRDARVFSSKIATDPRQLGVKGALDKRPSGSGIKGNFLVPQNYESENWSPRSFFQDQQ